MDKRAIIGIALSIFVLVVYQQLVSHFYPAPTPNPVTEKSVPPAEVAPAETKTMSSTAVVRRKFPGANRHANSRLRPTTTSPCSPPAAPG